jgi:hypothetical protein
MFKTAFTVTLNPNATPIKGGHVHKCRLAYLTGQGRYRCEEYSSTVAVHREGQRFLFVLLSTVIYMQYVRAGSSILKIHFLEESEIRGHGTNRILRARSNRKYAWAIKIMVRLFRTGDEV